MNRSFKIIGLMSGTSMDGLDICLTQFDLTVKGWSYQIIHTKGVAYPNELFNSLKNAVHASGLELLLLDKKIGEFFANEVNEFIAVNGVDKNDITAIASHGHTIFHQPTIGFTCQIGCGQTIASMTGIDTINEFRKKDVLNGGQGAPLVPIGDQLLFAKQADAFLNIGGFANFSKLENSEVVAYDICPANLMLNYYCNQLGKSYDRNGAIAQNNVVNNELFNQLNALPTYQLPQPESLGTEWMMANVLPLVEESLASMEDKIATLTEHAAFQIAKRLNENQCNKVFVTGGGAKNAYLIERIQFHFKGQLILPTEELIDFKEALIFGFLGALYLMELPNCLPSVTGATKAVVGGVFHKA